MLHKALIYILNGIPYLTTTLLSLFNTFQDIPKSDRHGTLTHYRISYIGLTSDYNNSIKLPVKDSAKSVTSAVLDLPSSQEDYSVRIVGATAKGESYHKSHIFVPSLEKSKEFHYSIIPTCLNNVAVHYNIAALSVNGLFSKLCHTCKCIIFYEYLS